MAFSSRCTWSRYSGVVARHPSGWGTSLLEGIFPLNEPIRARLFLLAPRPKSRRHHINKGWAWFEAKLLMFWLPGVTHTNEWCNACFGKPSWAPKRHSFLCIVPGIWSMRNSSIACWIWHWEDGQEKWHEDSNETETLRKRDRYIGSLS